MIIESGFEWSLFSALALLYSITVLAAVIILLNKGARLYDSDSENDMRFPGRVTGERPSERNPG
jgi:hypothetical protein